MRLELADCNLVGDPARDRRRLARAGARKDADRPAHGLHRPKLFRVEAGENPVLVHPCTVKTARDGDCAELVQSVFQNSGAGPFRAPEHRRQPRDDVESLAPLHHPL